MAPPLIGLTTRSIRSLNEIRLDRSQAVAEPYLEAVRWAGGLPVALPSCLGAEPANDSPPPGSGRQPWAQLLKRTFKRQYNYTWHHSCSGLFPHRASVSPAFQA